MQQRYERITSSKRGLDLHLPLQRWFNVIMCNERRDSVPEEFFLQLASDCPVRGEVGYEKPEHTRAPKGRINSWRRLLKLVTYVLREINQGLVGDVSYLS